MRRAVTLNGLVWGALALLAASCGEGVQLRARGLSDYISQVQTGDGLSQASLVEGNFPPASGGPASTPQVGSATLINGGSGSATVSSDVTFASIIIRVGGARDYYRLNLPVPVGQADILITLGQDPPADQFDCVFAVVDSQGRVGEYVGVPITVTRVGGGDVQVSVSWDAPSDVDLHVIDPSGAEIFFGNRQSVSGGQLDLDSNPGCALDNVNNENVTWPTDGAPSGTYTARVNLFSPCTSTTSRFLLTVQRAGASPLVFTGTLSADNANASFTFEYPPGSAPECPARVGDTLGDTCSSSAACGAGGLCVSGQCQQRCTAACTSLCTTGQTCLADAGAGGSYCGTAVANDRTNYQSCGTPTPGLCAESTSRCLGLTGFESEAAPFCAPACVDNACAVFGETSATCGLGADGSPTPTHCVLVCTPDTARPQADCPDGMECRQATETAAICIWPLTTP